MATLRATTSKATLAFFSGAIGVSKLAIRPGAATIRGSMTIGARCRIRFFSCLGARCLNEGGHVCFWHFSAVPTCPSHVGYRVDSVAKPELVFCGGLCPEFDYRFFRFTVKRYGIEL